MSNRIKITDKRGQAYKPPPDKTPPPVSESVIDGAPLDTSKMEGYIETAVRTKTHAWCAMVAIKVDDETLRSAVDQGDKPVADPENTLNVSLGCLVCNQLFIPGLLGTVCIGR